MISPPTTPITVHLPSWFWPVFAICFGLLLHICSYLVDRASRRKD